MKADAISEKILADARATAKQTLDAANARAEELRKKAELASASERDRMYERARRDCVEMRDRMLRMAELDQRKAQLAAKRQVIDAAFEDARKRMAAMPDQDKRAYLKGLLLENAEGTQDIVVSEGDAKIFDAAFIGELNAALNGKALLALSKERRETGGGFILKSGGMETNCTFAALLSQSRLSLEAEAAGKLFP